VALGVSGLGISEDFAIAQVDVDEIAQFARRKIQGLNPDCLFISGTNFPRHGSYPSLENGFWQCVSWTFTY